MVWTAMTTLADETVVTGSLWRAQVEGNMNHLSTHNHDGSAGSGADDLLAATFGFAGDADTYMGTPGSNTIAFTTAATEAVRITSGGAVAIGRTSSYASARLTTYSAAGGVAFAGVSDAAINSVDAYDFNAAPVSVFRGIAAAGSAASPAATPNAATLAGLWGYGYDNAGTPALTAIRGAVEVLATQAFTTAAQGTKIQLRTVPNGSTSLATRLTVDDTGVDATVGVQSSHATQGVGYATGAGGSITQVTSKSTSVTLNKICGQITTHNAALGAGASVVFQLANSAIAAGDTIVVVPANNAATGNVYRVEVAMTGAGFANIRLTNTSGGSLSEAVLINFAVIKAVNS